MIAAALAGGLSLLGPAGGAGPAVEPLRPPATVAAAADTGATVRGTVAAAGTGRPVPGASVRVDLGEGLRIAFADATGAYTLTGLGRGRRTLTVAAPGFDTLAVTLSVPGGGTLILDVDLAVRPIEMAPVAVSTWHLVRPAAEPGGGGSEEPDASARAGLRALETPPGVDELGLLEAVRGREPAGRDPAGALYVRGATSDLRLVLLDGAPVYAPFHLGGLLEPAQPGTLGRARLFMGGAPAAYGGALSSILDLETRRGRADEFHVRGRADLLGGGAVVEGPLGPGSFLAAARRTAPGVSDLVAPGGLPYEYREERGRADVDLAAGHALTLAGFHNREAVRLGGEATSGAARWGNASGSLRYRGHLDGTGVRATVAAGRFSTFLPLDGPTPEEAAGVALRKRASLDLTDVVGGVRVGAGMDVAADAVTVEVSDSARTVHETGSATRWGLYGEATVDLSRTVDLRTGLRSELFASGRRLLLSPRLALGWLPDPSTHVAVTVGRYAEYIRLPESILAGDLSSWTRPATAPESIDPLETLGAEVRRPRVSTATHVTVRLDHRPAQDVALGVEGFLKTFRGLAAAGQALHASGAELWADWEGRGWGAWAGYSLAWVWSDRSPEPTAARFSGRQLVSGGAHASLPSGLQLSGGVSASTGLPLAAVPLRPASGAGEDDGLASVPSGMTAEGTPALAGAPSGAYLRLDLEIARPVRTHLGGLQGRLTPYLRVLNALGRRDALFYRSDASGAPGARALDRLPIVPAIGLSWEF